MSRLKLACASVWVLSSFGAFAGYKSVDLRMASTTGFSDSVANDYMGGWFDEGRNDLRTFPVGLREFAGVPFDVIDPDKNSGASCIVLKSTNRPYFPPEVKGIPLPSGRWDRLHFLQASGWGDNKLYDKPVYVCKLTYRDGSQAKVPMAMRVSSLREAGCNFMGFLPS